ncbi:hypothetical protein [Neobacillus sp. LXY-4]|uniref:hypothetical protein n=1 Tax=Neobacillus sp. LXY-4 TaxID=3379826 RepID=UPI003EDFE07D
MYRISIEEEKWIIRFSPHLSIEKDERDAIVAPLLQIGCELDKFSHGDSFVIINENIGMIVCRVEKIPSLILIISAVVSKENWFVQKNDQINKFPPRKFL